MNYILDTNAIYYCSGASTHKKFSSPIFRKKVEKGRDLYISLWSILELATHFDFTREQINRVLKYIYNNQLKVLPFYVEKACSINIINTFLLEYGYILISTEIYYVDANRMKKKINGYILNKKNKHKSNKKTFKNIIKEKSRIEAFFLRFFFTSIYYNLLKLFEIDLPDQRTKDSFTKSCAKDVQEKIYSMLNEYEENLQKCYLGKTIKERREYIKKVKSDFFTDINFYILDIANLYEIYNTNGTYKFISKYFENVSKGVPYTNTAKKTSGNIIFNDFILEDDYRTHIENTTNELIKLEKSQINQECLKSYYLYINAINIKQLYQNSKIEKNDMFDVQYFSYYPDFYVFTCDKKMANNIKNINNTLYTELTPYL